MSALAQVPAELAPAAASRPVRDVMRAGVVLCDAHVSVREAARVMRDRGVRAVVAVDISSELLGLVDERAVTAGWDDPDEKTAGGVMDPDPLIVAPHEPLGAVARLMLERGATTVLVAQPPPTEESGVWSEWKERGMPLGTLTVADILARLDDLASVVRAAPPKTAGPGKRAAPWVALGTLILVVILVAVLLFAYVNGTHQYTNRPGL
jgi:CBS domain-containing protein